ncbi:MAG: hypothetical protein AAFQ63_11345 [Cyanobacteria bacterium J06621_11]
MSTRIPFSSQLGLVDSKRLNSAVRFMWLQLFTYLCLLIVYYLATLTLSYPAEDSQLLRWSNIIGPAALFVITFWTAYSIIRRHPKSVWTPTVLYLLSTGVFFGFGPLVYSLGNETTINSLSNNVVTGLTVLELSRTNLLNAVGTISAVIVIYAMLGINSFKLKNLQASSLLRVSYANLARTAIFFVVVGGFLRLFVILPYAFGLTNVVVPGVVNNLGNLVDLGLTIISYTATKRRGRWKTTLWIVWPIHLLTVILQFKKSVLVIALLLPVLGSYLASGKLKKLGVWVVAIAIVYNFSQPFVHYGRDIIKAKTGYVERATLSERFEITKQYFGEGIFLNKVDPYSIEQNSDNAEFQSGWTRLAYSGPQSFAMREYDAGRPGSTLRNAWIVFIPRILWPGKPVGIGPGRAFYEAVTGHARQAYLGLSVYGDGYWQWGWTGVIVLAGLMGAIFSVMSKFTLGWLNKGEMIFLPVILIPMQMALLGTTGFFINKILAVLPIYVAYIVAVNFFLMVMPNPAEGTR